jgi:hypothetical protein
MAPVSVLLRYCNIFEALLQAISLNSDINSLSVVDIFLSLDQEQLEVPTLFVGVNLSCLHP